jgi:hypothetical protein
MSQFFAIVVISVASAAALIVAAPADAASGQWELPSLDTPVR